MRKLEKRIEALEKRLSCQERERQGLSRSALRTLSVSAMEQLIGAFGGERQGRPLSEAEAAARQAYEEAIEHECGLAAVCPPRYWAEGIDIGHAMLWVLGEWLPSETLDLLDASVEAVRQGRALGPHQAEAVRAFDAEVARLQEKAGDRPDPSQTVLAEATSPSRRATFNRPRRSRHPRKSGGALKGAKQ